MDDFLWRSMADAPRDGQDIVVRTSGRAIHFFIRWDGDRWMNRSSPVSAELFDRFTWRPLILE